MKNHAPVKECSYNKRRSQFPCVRIGIHTRTGMCGIICDPLWEKVHFRAIIEFLLRAEIRKNSTVLAKLLFVTSENYGVASAFSRWSGVDSPLLALAASFRSCGRRLRMYCVIEIPHVISRNNARRSTYTFTRIVRGGKGL